MGFYEIDDIEYDFDDAVRGMMALIYIYIHYFIWWHIWGFLPYFMGFHLRFYGDDYVAMRSLWMDLWRGRIWAWLMLWCAPVVGGVAGVSITMDFGRGGDATVSSRDLPKPTPVVRLDIWYLIIDNFIILKPIPICFIHAYVLWFRALVVSDVTLARRC